MLRIANYINGEFAAPASGKYLDNVDPAIGTVYSQLPDSDQRDVDSAVQAAEQAFPKWSATPAADRSRILLKIAELIETNLEKLARAESIDSGKPISLAKSLDIPRAASNFRFFATAILHTQSEAHFTEGPARAINYTLRQPRGVAGLISPWNLPLYLFTWKVAPALATGNTAVAKPSEITPMTAYLLGEICQQAGLPRGVLNIVHGLGPKAGAAIVAHPGISAISFTGGTKTGAEIARVAGPMFKKLSLELGGKNPNIVFADADLNQAIPASVRSSFANQGQICLCGSRIFVERSIYDSFIDRFVAYTTKLRIGDPLDPQTEQGAIASKQHLEKITSYMRLAADEGGTLLCGGKRPKGLPDRVKDGFFIEPTVITGLNCDARTNQEEIFGPVVTISPFDRDQEVIDMANDVEYGLSASIWTRNLDRAHAVAAQIQSGTVWVNCWLLRDLRVPFGGTKNSGVGREGGDEAIRFFTEPKNVCIAMKFP
ncbi:MAG: aldehyde dehydrogenase [Phycisphaerales bacterium]|nr:aldehyde dehydrogenase [Phycisphaerales bacterium]